MTIEQLKNQLPAYAKDIRLNLSTIFSEEGAPNLNLKQIYLIALGSAFALKNHTIIDAILSDAHTLLSEHDIEAAKAAATIMAMNNIYYRFTHLVNDSSFTSMPAKLRMNIISNPGIEKINFELICLAISAINGCGICISAHTQELIKSGITNLGIQSTIRIASILNAMATGLAIS